MPYDGHRLVFKSPTILSYETPIIPHLCILKQEDETGFVNANRWIRTNVNIIRCKRPIAYVCNERL